MTSTRKYLRLRSFVNTLTRFRHCGVTGADPDLAHIQDYVGSNPTPASNSLIASPFHSSWASPASRRSAGRGGGVLS